MGVSLDAAVLSGWLLLLLLSQRSGHHTGDVRRGGGGVGWGEVIAVVSPDAHRLFPVIVLLVTATPLYSTQMELSAPLWI